MKDAARYVFGGGLALIALYMALQPPAASGIAAGGGALATFMRHLSSPSVGAIPDLTKTKASKTAARVSTGTTAENQLPDKSKLILGASVPVTGLSGLSPQEA